MTEPLKILISAYACSPYRGSEPGVGWGFVAELAKHHRLWVIVEEEKFRLDIENYLIENPSFPQTVKFYFIHKQRNRRLRRYWPPSYYWYYRQWHKKALKLARDLHQEVHFDLAHQLTMVGFREPGYLWQLGIPFVWGPVGGMGFFPWKFLTTLDLYGCLYYIAYNLINGWQMRFARRPRLAATAAGIGLIAATAENLEGAAKYWRNPSSLLINEVGMPPIHNGFPTVRKPDEPLQLVWSGLHIPRKALHIALEALALIPASQSWQLHVLGNGPCTSNWQELAKRLGIASRCHFHGWLPREQALQRMQQSHLMLITSLRDLTSTVTIEAMAQGLPIICLDHCGFANVVDDSCGIKIPVTTPMYAIQVFAEAITLLANDEPQRSRLALGAIERAKDFCWENKIVKLNALYQQKILTSSPPG